MRLLRVKLFQETACYQKPLAFKVGETYPLAPFSTVKGMLHAVLDAKEYIPMNISIQGQSETMLLDYASKFMYKKSAVQLPLNVAGLGIDVELSSDITSMPMYVHLLYNIEHVIHIAADQEILDQLYTRLSRPRLTLSIGRWEDLVRIDEVTFVEPVLVERVIAPLDMYIPKSWVDNYEDEFSGETTVKSYYRLPRKYEIRNGKRNWDYVSVIYVTKGLDFINLPLSDGEYPIFLMEG